MPFLPISGPVVSDTCYVEDVLSAKDVSVTFPEVAAITSDINAMGTMSIPIWQLLEDMELTINAIGTDMGLVRMLKPQSIPMEFRFVHISTDANAVTKNVGCKAFVKCMPKNIPTVEIVPGEPMENEVKATVSRYQMFADGEELWLIDRLAGIVRIGGVDYSENINSML